jgi:hypothetical protein
LAYGRRQRNAGSTERETGGGTGRRANDEALALGASPRSATIS